MKITVKTRSIIALSVLGAVLLSAGGYYLLRYSGSTYKKAPERVVYAGTESDSVLLDTSGTTQGTRILAPEGYVRESADEDSLLAFMRNLEVLPNGNPIVTYTGEELSSSATAVYTLDVGGENLQQCADSVIRVFSEYFWSQGEYDRITFHLTNGELMKYTDWRDGKRLVAAGSFTTQLKLATSNNSYECFRAYLACVMNYAGTRSLYDESKAVPLSEFRPGDMLLIPGSPGHVVLAVDMAVNEEGEKCYLLAQGYMPAQSFHIIRNNAHPEDPWYYQSELEGDFYVQTYHYEQDNLRRWQEGF